MFVISYFDLQLNNNELKNKSQKPSTMKTEVTEEQMDALKCFVIHSDVDDETKKVILALISASDNLTQPIAITLYSKEVISNVRTFIQSENKLCLRLIMKLIGANYNPYSDKSLPKNLVITSSSAWRFTSCDGYFLDGIYIQNIKPGTEYTRTIWLSLHPYDREAMEITQKEVNAIEPLSLLNG